MPSFEVPYMSLKGEPGDKRRVWPGGEREREREGVGVKDTQARVIEARGGPDGERANGDSEIHQRGRLKTRGVLPRTRIWRFHFTFDFSRLGSKI